MVDTVPNSFNEIYRQREIKNVFKLIDGVQKLIQTLLRYKKSHHFRARPFNHINVMNN